MVPYNIALQMWGAKRLTDSYANSNVEVNEVDLDSVKVSFEFDEGFACCAGSDPECYCSLVESPSADVVIGGRTTGGDYLHSVCIDADSFNFVEILNEIVTVSGTITL